MKSLGLSCSFCGSLHPDRFMELIREGWNVGPTDKNYKAYLSRLPASEEANSIEAKFYYQHLSPEQQVEFVELYNTKRMHVGYPGRFYRWPFFMGPVT